MVRHCDFHLLCPGGARLFAELSTCQRGVTVKIEGITVCVQYADFFAETIDRMCHAVDHLFVVTTTADKDTQQLCLNRPKITVVETDAFYRDGMTFSVGAGVNEGLKACNRDNWVLVLDADTALPWHTREAWSLLTWTRESSTGSIGQRHGAARCGTRSKGWINTSARSSCRHRSD